MGIFLATPVGPFHNAVGAAFGTFTTKQDVSPQPLPVLQGGTLVPGAKLWIKAVGEFSTTATPTLSLGFWAGTQAGSITIDIAVSSVITTGSGAVAWPWEMEWTGTVTSVGVAGSVTGSGFLLLGTALTTFAAAVPVPITAALRTFALDTTIARAIGVSAAYSASSASNTVKVNSLTVNYWNGP